MKTADFDYPLSPKHIAQTPADPRDAARLLVLNRQSGELTHAIFRDIGRFLNPGDLFVLNQTRVLPARLFGRKIPTGGQVEVLLLRQEDSQTWEVIVRGKGLQVGKYLELDGVPNGKVPLEGEILAVLDGPRRIVRFSEPLEPHLDQIGHVPLPPYIKRPISDPECYQTVYAQDPGSVAAPTAGLHFTPELITQLEAQGVRFAFVTLHIGLDTFAPVHADTPRDHKIHTEWCQVSPETVQWVNKTRRLGGRIVCVGTTSVRALETAACEADSGNVARHIPVEAFEGPTDLFIFPGHIFRAVDALVTNFHLPKSTLLMMVSAFAGRERMLSTYETAKQEGYRFYSIGDAMLIL